MTLRSSWQIYWRARALRPAPAGGGARQGRRRFHPELHRFASSLLSATSESLKEPGVVCRHGHGVCALLVCKIAFQIKAISAIRGSVSCGYHKVLRTKPQSQRKRIQTQRIFEAAQKATNRFLNTIPKQASRSCWPCGLSARCHHNDRRWPGDLPSSYLRLCDAIVSYRDIDS